MTSFDEWFERERAAGLVDIKLSIKPGGTLEQVQNEILEIEKQLALGNVRTIPSAITFIPPHIQDIVNGVII